MLNRRLLGSKVLGRKQAYLGDASRLVLRLTLGALLAGHGAQKLFGSFDGPGFAGTARWLESIGFRSPRVWAALAGLSELGGGVLTALGLLEPLGSLGVFASMGMATAKVHAGKPIWGTKGGAEQAVTNMAMATSIVLGGPGRFSLDEVLDTHLPRWVALPGLAAVAAGIALGLRVSTPQPQEKAKARTAGAEAAAP